MSQERMHPDDLRAIMAAQLALSSDDLTTGDVARGIEGADAILAELARTARPEAPKEDRRIAELEQWQWDNMKKWLGIIGWGSMTPTQPECPTLIDAALQQGVEDAKRVDTLEARVKELEEAIKKHRSIVKGSQHWRGCDCDEDLWSRVK